MVILRSLTFLVFITLLHEAEACEKGHLVPVGPDFDVKAPYAKAYAKLCEEKLFAGPNWVIRYHAVTESSETGLSITKKDDGTFWLIVRQAKPQLGSAVSLAFDVKWDLKLTLSEVKIKRAETLIPGDVVTAILEFWISLLTNVRPEVTESPFFSDKVILFAKSAQGKILAGKLPSDPGRCDNMRAARDIGALLIVCAEDHKKRGALFGDIKRMAQAGRDVTKKRR